MHLKAKHTPPPTQHEFLALNARLFETNQMLKYTFINYK